MRILLLTALLGIPASAASAPSPSAPLFLAPDRPEPVISLPAPDGPVINPSRRAALGLCPPTTAQVAANGTQTAEGRDLIHKLTELPPANAYVAVYRQVNGCEAPIVVKYGLGRR